MVKVPRKRRRLRIAAIISLPVVIIIALCCWGRLLPYTPVVVGFQRQAFTCAVVYYHHRIDVQPFAQINALVAAVESSHGMRFTRRVQLVACGSMGEFSRLTGSAARGITFPPYGRIFMSPKALGEARGGKIHFDVYLKHELSHALLFQHMPITRCLVLPVWLREGLAVQSAGQLGCDAYLSKDAVRRCMQQGYFLNPDDCGKARRHAPAYVKRQPPLIREPRFWYAESACLVDDLMAHYGKVRFFRFVTMLLQEGNAQDDFRRVFGTSFLQYVQDFRQRWGSGGNTELGK